MNPQFITTTNVNNNSDNTKETKSQQCMSDSVTKSYNTFFGDEYVPKGHITTHPFNLTLEELSDQLNNGQESCESVVKRPNAISQNLQVTPHQDCSGSTENSRELLQFQPAGGSRCLNQSTIPGLIQDGQRNSKNYQTPQTKPHQDCSGSTENSRELSQYKPVGGSGWLHKYTKLKSTKNGLIEYPRVPEGKRSPENHKHWYWDYCWQKKGKNGKPLSKAGSNPVIESTYCPQKKVRAVQNAIAAKLPHRQILKIIKGDNSPPSST